MKILLAESDRNIRSAVVRALELAGHKVAAFFTKEEALRFNKFNVCDILIADCEHYPKVSRATDKINKEAKFTKIVTVSPYTNGDTPLFDAVVPRTDNIDTFVKNMMDAVNDLATKAAI